MRINIMLVQQTAFQTEQHKSSFWNSIPQDSSSPQEHAQYVWKKFVEDAKAKRIYIVAHSFGGVVTVDLVSIF